MKSCFAQLYAARFSRDVVKAFARVCTVFSMMFSLVLSPAAWSASSVTDAGSDISDLSLAANFEREVRPRLNMPIEEELAYSARLQQSLEEAHLQLESPQYVLLVDRNPKVQAVMIFLGSMQRGWSFVGASPISTGLPGQFDHFTTPLGVFEHTLANPDFRALGTKNELGFRGYGVKGMRVYDFGWVDAERGWGKGGLSEMRLQMHATDPDLAENLLGVARSKGCVRIPAALNDFIDRYALLDVDYLKRAEEGNPLWILRADRTPTLSPGRYMVVIDSARQDRPDWSPLPNKRLR